MEQDEYFGEVVSEYSSGQAVEDGVLMANPRQDRFGECNLITSNLYARLEDLAMQRNLSRINPIDQRYLCGCLMMMADELYRSGRFVGDNNKDFFVLPQNQEGIVVWYVRNETGKLTAMLPEDY